MELSQLCTILGAAQSSNPQQRKAAEQTLLQVVFLATPLLHSAGNGLHADVLANSPGLAGLYKRPQHVAHTRLLSGTHA
jgi:hypothetical protein